MKKFAYTLLLFLTSTAFFQINAQWVIKGTVFDSTGTYPVQHVSVLCTAGTGATTNANGEYSISVSDKDSIWFSYLNKPTRKFPVKSIKTLFCFNISLQTFITLLPGVKARARDYRRDSVRNREDYAKIFNYERPGLRVSSLNNGSVGFDLNSLIESFQFRKNKRMLAFQNRLVNQEQEAFIKHRFSKALVRRITAADNDSVITVFIETYLPSFLFTSTASDYVFHKYVKDSYERFRHGIAPTYPWREGATSEADTIYRKEDD